MMQDERELTLSGADSTGVARYNAIVQDYFDYRASVFGDLKTLCADHPNFAMAHLLKGYLLLSMGTQGTVPAVQKIYQHLLDRSQMMTEREQLHNKALDAWSRGNTALACHLWDRVLTIAPLDLLAIKLQHFALFWMGNPHRMRDTCARVMPYWDSNTPGQAYLLGMLAFALEETGEYALAEEHALNAYERQPDDLWSLHAVAHIYEMQGRLDEGAALFDKPLSTYDDRNPFRGHIWWHAALFALERGDTDHVFALYDQAIRPAESTFYLDIQNSVSLLARMEMTGIDVGDRWDEVADVVQAQQGDHVLMFTEPHCTMALGRTQRFEQLDDQLQSLQAFVDTPDNSSSPLVPSIVAPLCEALRDYYHGQYQSTIDELATLRYDMQPLGGSHAQRDVFNLFLIDAALKDNQPALAQGFLAERVARHPNSRTSWQRYEAVCRDLQDTHAQTKAQQHISRLRQ